MSNKQHFDIALVGGGILGLATARELQCRYPRKSILILEQESKLAAHQTGRNSGVIHAGIYYTPGSLKARFCREGNRETIAFCNQNNIHYEQCGKLIVATQESELPRLNALYERAITNGLDVQRWDESRIQATEPHINAQAAIYVKDSGIIDYGKICEMLAAQITANGGHIALNHKLTEIRQESRILGLQTTQTFFSANALIACPGIEADRIVKLAGGTPKFRMIPFRGEYFQLPLEKGNIVRHLIYPVPDPALPFLGVHITRMIDGSITVGPNAMLALSRYGYHKTDINWRDVFDILSYPGALRLLWNNLRPGLHELVSSLSKTFFSRRAQAICPTLQTKDLLPYPSGIRAQAVLPNGKMADDFLFERNRRILVVCNAPSPAATSAFPIARHIVNMAAELITN